MPDPRLLENYLARAAEENRSAPRNLQGNRIASQGTTDARMAKLRGEVESGGDGLMAGWGDVATMVSGARDPLMEALGQLTPTGSGAEYLPAMIPTGKNLGKFTAKMKDARKTIDPRLSGDLADAMAYMTARYPNRSKAAKIVGLRKDLNHDTSTYGSFYPQANAIVVGDGPKLPKLVETLAHETQHAVDHKRLGRNNLKKDSFTNYQDVGTLQEMGFSPEYAYEVYANQPIERRAFKAGKTGADGLEEFRNLQDYMISEGGFNPKDAYDFSRKRKPKFYGTEKPISSSSSSGKSSVFDKIHKFMMGIDQAVPPLRDSLPVKRGVAQQNLREAITSEALDTLPAISPKLTRKVPSDAFSELSWKMDRPKHPRIAQQEALDAALNLFRTGK